MGASGWLGWLSIRLQLRSWSPGSWVRTLHQALCCQHRAYFRSCIPLSLCLFHAPHPAKANRNLKKEKEHGRWRLVPDTPFFEMPSIAIWVTFSFCDLQTKPDHLWVYVTEYLLCVQSSCKHGFWKNPTYPYSAALITEMSRHGLFSVRSVLFRNNTERVLK